MVDNGHATFNVESLQTCVGIVVSLEKSLNNRVLANASNENPGEITAPIVKKLRKLHTLIVSDSEHCDIAVTLLRTNFFSTVSFSAATILKFSELTDNVLRVILPLIRLPTEIRKTIMTQLLANGGLIFALLALKQHMQQSASIRVQGLDLLCSVLESVSKSEKELAVQDEEIRQHTLNQRQPAKYPGTNSSQRTPAQDAVHQLLLHGAASTLSRLLTLSVNNLHEISVRRAISCLTFLVLETPSDLALKVASYEGWATLRALHTVMRDMSLSARIDAAALLTGLLASNIQVAEQIHAMGADDDLSSILAQNAAVIKVPRHWLLDSLEKIRMVSNNSSNDIKGPASATLGAVGGVDSNRSPFFDIRSSSLQDEPFFMYGFDGRVPFDPLEGGSEYLDTSSLMSKPNLAAVVDALLDTHAAVDAGARKSNKLGMLSHKHLEAQLQRHMGKARQSFSGFIEMQETYLPPKRPQSAVSSSRKKVAVEPKEKNYIKHLKASPLGHPMDPAQLRKELRENGGVLPEYVPAALGGKALGRRPGAPVSPRGAKGRGKKSVVPTLPPRPLPVQHPISVAKPSEGSSGNKAAKLKKDKAAAGRLASTPLNETIATHDTSKTANFVAVRLFKEEGNQGPAARPSTASAIDRLSFAEKLQCMIMSLKDL